MPKILIFEDDKMLAEMYSAKLKEKGLKYKCFDCPPDNVIDVVSKERPDLISMGVVMPNMDGFQATELLKSDDKTKDIPLVFLTNLGQDVDKKRGLDLGAVEYIVKAKHTPTEVIEIFEKEIYKSKIIKGVKSKIDAFTNPNIESISTKVCRLRSEMEYEPATLLEALIQISVYSYEPFISKFSFLENYIDNLDEDDPEGDWSIYVGAAGIGYALMNEEMLSDLFVELVESIKDIDEGNNNAMRKYVQNFLSTYNDVKKEGLGSKSQTLGICILKNYNSCNPTPEDLKVFSQDIKEMFDQIIDEYKLIKENEIKK
jgi:CheY-like chemotaxis protein